MGEWGVRLCNFEGYFIAMVLCSDGLFSSTYCFPIFSILFLGLQTVLVHHKPGATIISATAVGYQHVHLITNEVKKPVILFPSDYCPNKIYFLYPFPNTILVYCILKYNSKIL